MPFVPDGPQLALPDTPSFVGSLAAVVSQPDFGNP
jgi:hypothetical protein